MAAMNTNKVVVKVFVKIRTDTAYEGTVGAEDIKENLTTYINNLGVGESVILSALYGQIHNVSGVDEVLELKLSKDGENFEAKNITVEKWEVVSCESVTVEVMNE